MSGQCPLYPQKRTLRERIGMSALCQKRTSHTLFAKQKMVRWCELRPQVSTEAELEQLDSVRAPDAASIGVRKLGLVKPSGRGCHLLVGVVHRKHNPGRPHLGQRTVERRVVKLAASG